MDETQQISEENLDETIDAIVRGEGIEIVSDGGVDNNLVAYGASGGDRATVRAQVHSGRMTRRVTEDSFFTPRRFRANFRRWGEETVPEDTTKTEKSSEDDFDFKYKKSDKIKKEEPKPKKKTDRVAVRIEVIDGVEYHLYNSGEIGATERVDLTEKSQEDEFKI